MPDTAPANPPTALRVGLAFAAIYLIWGSTYLAIRFAIETLPPFLMAGVRFLIAGTILYSWVRLRGATKPAPIHWRSAVIIGGLLLMGGNGGVVWAEQHVPSSIAALLIAAVPLWMVLLDWLRPRGTRPALSTIVGLLLGFGGVALLVGQGHSDGTTTPVDPLGAAVLICAALAWAIGSLYARGAPLPRSQLLTAAMEMLAGGLILTLAGLASGEWARLDIASVSLLSLLALAYLILFGAIIGFSAYVWLLQVTTPARVSTYAYVNPTVAFILGWLLAGEEITPRTLLAGAIIVASVVIIITRGIRARPSAPPVPQASPESPQHQTGGPDRVPTPQPNRDQPRPCGRTTSAA